MHAPHRHMFFDGVFDNLEGMKYIPDGEPCFSVDLHSGR